MADSAMTHQTPEGNENTKHCKKHFKVSKCGYFHPMLSKDLKCAFCELEKLRTQCAELVRALEPFAEEAKNRTELRYKLESSRGYPYPEGECEQKYRNFMRDSEKYWAAEEALAQYRGEVGE